MKWNRTFLTLAALGLGVCVTRPAVADDGAALPPADFAKGTWTLSLYGGYDRECASDPQLAYAAVGAGYFVVDGVSLNAEVRAYDVRQRAGDDAALFELDVLLRHHVLKGENWSIFLDVGAGVSEATRRVPAGGTNFNFVEEAGVGATYRVADGVHLIGGARYWHLSNARLHGGDENPGLNGVGGYVGLMFRL